MAGYLLDTPTIIEHLRGNRKVNSRLEEIGQRGDIAGCCCINIAETYTGMREKEKEKTDRFIESLYYFEVTREIAKLAGKLRKKYAKKGKTLATTDVIIAATAITYGLTLITKNIKHYPFPELKIEEI
ncbi:type II toxin-antitoxin system VapC family toxin [Candidatus Aerophobetes bacterium]|nr:type II toxin-antitoxin system VapC family toxin [Candidatus Aerophobetes bacterium]